MIVADLLYRIYILFFVCFTLSEESSSSHTGKTYKPMAKLSSTVMEQKMKTLEPPPKLVCTDASQNSFNSF